jgi:hypothetical protein
MYNCDTIFQIDSQNRMFNWFLGKLQKLELFFFQYKVLKGKHEWILQGNHQGNGILFFSENDHDKQERYETKTSTMNLEKVIHDK